MKVSSQVALETMSRSGTEVGISEEYSQDPDCLNNDYDSEKVDPENVEDPTQPSGKPELDTTAIEANLAMITVE